MNNEAIKELVNSHWDYVQDVICTTDPNTASLEVIEFHYKTAMLHGLKHGLEMKHGAEEGPR